MLIFRFLIQNASEEAQVEYSAILCHDVFLEVLRWGNRRQLVKLERIGQRFHWNVERFFLETPFLRLDLRIEPRLLTFLPTFVVLFILGTYSLYQPQCDHKCDRCRMDGFNMWHW